MVGVYLYRIISERPRLEGRSEDPENKVKRCGASLSGTQRRGSADGVYGVH